VKSGAIIRLYFTDSLTRILVELFNTMHIDVLRPQEESYTFGACLDSGIQHRREVGRIPLVVIVFDVLDGMERRSVRFARI